MAKSGWADILELLFWTGIFEILAKTVVTQSRDVINFYQARNGGWRVVKCY